MKFEIWGFVEILSTKLRFRTILTKITGTEREETPLYISDSSCLAQFFLECEMFQKNFVEKTKTHILHSIIFFPKIVPFM